MKKYVFHQISSAQDMRELKYLSNTFALSLKFTTGSNDLWIPRHKSRVTTYNINMTGQGQRVC